MRTFLFLIVAARLATAAPPSITTASLPNGTVSTAYSQTLAATGGAGANQWSVSAGTLPAGLSLSMVGVLAGTPTTAGTSNFTVQVKDSANATATKALSLVIAPAPLSITTASLPNGTVGGPYSQTLAASGGAGSNQWSVSAGTLPAGLTLSAAGVLAGTPTTAGTSNFTVQVKDSANATATKALSLVIVPAPLSITTASLPNGTVGAAYSQTLAASGGAGSNQWSVSAGTLPAGLSLSAAGILAGTPTTAGSSNFTVQVKDSANTTATKALSLVIAPPALSITTASLPNGTVGAAYSQTLAASGGAGGNQWSVSAGTLPAGLSLSMAGVLAGTPTTAGTANFTVQVKDSASTTATKALSLVIAPAALSITTASLPNGTVGVAYSQTLAATGGAGGNQWSVSAGTLSAGLSLSADGALAGTPTTAGTSNFTVQVKDSANMTATKALSLVIAPPPLSITTASLPNGTAGSAYSQTLTASGGAGGNQWSITAGTLPAGLTLSNAGIISGTPTTGGTSNFTVQVKDSANGAATKALSIAITATPVVITTSALPNAAHGISYTFVLTASGGSGTYRWSITGGALPEGLVLDISGRIQGAPSGGTSSFTVQATDSVGATGTRSLTLTVTPALLFTSPATLPTAVTGSPYTFTFAATGGAPPYSFSIVSGELPAGLSLNGSAGTVTGTATLAGGYTFTIQVTDAAGVSSTGPFGINVRPPLQITNPATLANGSMGALFRQILTLTGGVPPFTWSVVGGSLPAGLSLNPGTGELSGLPSQAGVFQITVQVQDSAGTQVQAKLSLTIANGLTITTPPVLPAGNAGLPYQFTMEAAGGAPAYIWSVSAGALPPGLAFHSDGKFDGSPTTSGSYSFTVLVVDSSSSRASKEVTISIASALTLTTANTLPNGAVGSTYTTTLAGTGGTPPYVFTVSGGTPPAGLTLEPPTGALTGTPTAAGNFNFTVTLTDAASLTAQKAFSITITPGLIFSSAATLPDAVAGVPYAFTITAAGGATPYAFRISTGAMPDGLTLNASSGVVAGTPAAAGTFNFTLEVTDAARITASRVHALVVALPSAPALLLDSVPATVSALQQPTVDLTVSGPYPVAITGRIVLRFNPANGMPDDPAVQFSTGGRSAAFTIPANSTHAAFATPQFAIQAGSVAGTIDFLVDGLDASGSPLPAPAGAIRTVQVPPAAPVIRTASVNRTTGGFDLVIVGLSNTRDVTQATVRFRPGAGSNLRTDELTVPLTDAAKGWFSSGGSAAYGGQFTLTLPFSIVGGANVVDAVTVILNNSAGASAESSAQY